MTGRSAENVIVVSSGLAKFWTPDPSLFFSLAPNAVIQGVPGLFFFGFVETYMALGTGTFGLAASVFADRKRGIDFASSVVRACRLRAYRRAGTRSFLREQPGLFEDALAFSFAGEPLFALFRSSFLDSIRGEEG